MEDRHAVVAVADTCTTEAGGAPTANTRLLFVVLDGHGGYECAEYAATALPAAWAQARREVLRHPRAARVNERTAAGECAASAMHVVDNSYRRAFPGRCDSAGSAVVGVWVDPTGVAPPAPAAPAAAAGGGKPKPRPAGTVLTVAWLGDSRAALGGVADAKTGKWGGVGLSQDHKPDDPAERQRIEAAGGKVTPNTWRDCARVWYV